MPLYASIQKPPSIWPIVRDSSSVWPSVLDWILPKFGGRLLGTVILQVFYIKLNSTQALPEFLQLPKKMSPRPSSLVISRNPLTKRLG